MARDLPELVKNAFLNSSQDAEILNPSGDHTGIKEQVVSAVRRDRIHFCRSESVWSYMQQCDANHVISQIHGPETVNGLLIQHLYSYHGFTKK